MTTKSPIFPLSAHHHHQEPEHHDFMKEDV